MEKEIESIGERQDRTVAKRVLGASEDEEDLIRRYRRIEQLLHRLQASLYYFLNKLRV
jgi:hypothetical protein